MSDTSSHAELERDAQMLGEAYGEGVFDQRSYVYDPDDDLDTDEEAPYDDYDYFGPDTVAELRGLR